MQQQPEQDTSTPRRKRRKVMVDEVGQKAADGTLNYPGRTLQEVAVALCQRTTTEGMQGVYGLVIEAIRARPEFANMRLYSANERGSYDGAYSMIIDHRPETQGKVRSDILPSATHRDPEQMTHRLICARFMWKMRALLERNLAARQTLLPLLPRDQPLSNQLPVPMQSFCESEGTWWTLMRRITQWIYGAFAGTFRLSA